MKLNTKIIIMVAEIALIPWVVGGLLAFFSAQEQLNASTYMRLDSLATLQKTYLQDALKNRLDTFELIAGSSRAIGLMRDFNASPTVANKRKIQDLIETPGKAPHIKRVFIATNEGVVIASSDPAVLGAHIQGEDYFKRGLKANDESVLRKETADTVVQYIAGPLMQDGRIEGVAVMVVDADDIVSVSRDFSGLGKTGETLLIEKYNGDSIRFITPTRFNAHTALSLVVKSSEVDVPAEHAVAGEEELFANLTDYRGVKVFAVTRFISSVGWGIVVKIDRSEAYAPIQQLQDLFLVIIAIVALLIVVITAVISRVITRPVNVLIAFANKIAQGDLSQSIVISSKDEVGELAVAFNTMATRLHESYTTLEKKVAERTNELAEKTAEARNSEAAALNIAADLKDEEEKLAEEKTKAEELANDLKKFKLALDNASDQVTITDPEGTVVYANAAVERITGYTPEEAIGKKSGALWKSPMPPEYYKSLWHTIKERKETFIGEIENKRKNGTLYTAAISISPVLDNDGNVVFFVGLERDITKEKEIDIAKNEFISLASHQMRTPLTAINWYTEMLLGGDAGKLSVKQKEYFTEVYNAGRRMNEIIKAFLHILRLETGTQVKNFLPTDLVAIASSVTNELKLEAGKKKLKVVEKYEKPSLSVVTDADLARVIVQNFVSNALKYSKEGGEVVISLGSVAKGSSIAGTLIDRDSFLVSVSDSGIGIPEDVREKIFTKFFRADNAKVLDPNGNGLGLYMTKIMVDIIGGTVWFASKEGEGTTFYLLLPKEATTKVV